VISCCQDQRAGLRTSLDILGWLWWVASVLVTGGPVADLVLDLRLGVDAVPDRLADDRHLFPEVRLVNCRKLEANQNQGVRGLFHQLNQGTRRRCGWLREVVQTVGRRRGEGVWRRQHFKAVTAVDAGRPRFCGADLREVDRCWRGSNGRVCALVLSAAWCWGVPRTPGCSSSEW
jgi:hypothetical protein